MRVKPMIDMISAIDGELEYCCLTDAFKFYIIGTTSAVPISLCAYFRAHSQIRCGKFNHFLCMSLSVTYTRMTLGVEVSSLVMYFSSYLTE